MPSHIIPRAQSKTGTARGKNKYTLAPIDNQRTLNKSQLLAQQSLPNQQSQSFSQVSPIMPINQQMPLPSQSLQSLQKAQNSYQRGGQIQNNNSFNSQRGTVALYQTPQQHVPRNTYNQITPYSYQMSDMSPVLYQGQNQGKLMNPREFEMELSGIRSVDEVLIDHSSVLAIKRGDLAIIQGEVFKCRPAAPHLKNIPLVLKRLDCVDRRIYDLKVYECDTFMRFRGHPNIISLYSYWSEKAGSPYHYKALVCLYEEGLLGDMLKTVVLNPVRPSNRLAMKYLCDICKGLASLNNCNIIHGSVKPSSIYIQGDNTAMIGELGKVELDSARHTHQLFSKILIQDAMPHTLIYWAPEVLRLERFTTSADMWSLGVTMYQVITGEHPFNVSNEEIFKDDLFSANVDWSRLAGYPRLKIIIENLLRVDPYKRWDANMVLAYAQEYFVIDIQRVWRGFQQRQEFRRKCRGLIMIQAHMKGFVTKAKYRKDRVSRKDQAALKIQSHFRAFRERKQFLIQKNALMKCQANVLTRQHRRAYLKMRSDVNVAQQYIKRYLAMLWYKRIKEQKDQLENNIENINEMISKFNVEANSFKNQFVGKEITRPLEYLNNFEQYELVKGKRGMVEKSHVPRLHHLNQEYEKLLEENKKLQDGVQGSTQRFQQMGNKGEPGLNDEELKNELGEKYEELDEMVHQLKENLKRVAQQAKQAQQLPIKMQHQYQYSKWDSIHEPYNVVENVLKDDESVYKALTPNLDFTLHNGQPCFVAEVILYPGDCGPQNVEILVSNQLDKWAFVKSFTCTKSGPQRLILPGEHVCKFLRLKCINNVRGGNIVNVRYIVIKGLLRSS